MWKKKRKREASWKRNWAARKEMNNETKLEQAAKRRGKEKNVRKRKAITKARESNKTALLTDLFYLKYAFPLGLFASAQHDVLNSGVSVPLPPLER